MKITDRVAALRRRFPHQEEPNTYGYDTIQHEGLKDFLIRFEAAIVVPLNDGLVPLINAQMAVGNIVGFEFPKDVSPLFGYIKKGAIELVGVPDKRGTRLHIDANGLRAAGALAWTFKENHDQFNHGLVNYFSGLADLTKRNIGSHPLADLIEEPVAPRRRQAEQSDTAKEKPIGLTEFLDRFHQALPITSPMRLSYLAVDRKVREALGLKARDMAFLMKGIRGSALIEPILERAPYFENSTNHYDSIRMDALVAIAWSMQQALSEPYHTNLVTVDWQQIARYAREELGDNPAAQIIHIERGRGSNVSQASAAVSLLEKPAVDESRTRIVPKDGLGKQFTSQREDTLEKYGLARIPSPPDPPFSKEEISRLLERVTRVDMSRLFNYLSQKEQEEYVDFNTLPRGVFPAVALAMRAKVIAQGDPDAFDSQLSKIRYGEAATAVDRLLHGMLSQPTAALLPGNKWIEILDAMEKLVRERMAK